MSTYLSKRFLGIAAYVPGEQPQDRSYIKLNTNESPFSPSPAVLATLNAEQTARLNLYPDPDAREAGAAISRQFGLQPENIILGNGSDELLAFAFQAFCDESVPAVYADITYGFYSVFARINCIASRVIPLDAALNLVPREYYKAGGTIFIANPNSPTGRAVPLESIETIIRENCDKIVVVDEAYVAFGAQSAVPLIAKYDNLIVVHTMSKSKNLAGARIGYALADSALIADLNIMKFSFNPYNVSRLSLLAAIAAINDEAYYNECVEKLIKTREQTATELQNRGFEVLPSKSNFLFAKPGFTSGEDYYLSLKKRGVLVRHFATELIKDYVRITIGSDEQMRELLTATDAIQQTGTHP